MHSAVAYRNLIGRLEREAATRPGWYRFKLLLMAVLGYAFLLVAVGLALALSVGLAALLLVTKSVWALKLIKFAWIPLVLAWLILKALWIRLSDPVGYALSPGEAPVLVAEVERLRQATGAPALAGIVIDPELNAAAHSVPRLLGLAGSRHFLVLGLPLMRSLGPQELAAVIAHEFGHFNAGHGRFAGWIYRVRVSWYRLLESLQQQRSAASTLFIRFFDWYAPYFNAYSFVLARENEYEADAVSARLVGAESAGQALVRVELASQRLAARFWPEVERLNQVEPEPPASLYGNMAQAVRAADADDADALAGALARPSSFDDTHPTLAQRLGALAVEARLPESEGPCAAEYFLGPLADQLQERFDAQWRDWVKPGWQERFNEHAEGRGQLQQLRELRSQRDLDAAEALQYAVLIDNLAPEEDAVALFREALRLDPNQALGHFRLGSLLLPLDSPAAIGHLEEAMRLSPEATEPALQLLAAHHHRNGDDAALDVISERQRRWYGQQAKALAERQRLGKKDVFEAHGLDQAQEKQVRDRLAAHGKIGKAWLVRKQVPNGDSYPHFVVLVTWRGVVLSEEGQLQRLVDGLELPGSVYAVTSSIGWGISRRIKRAAGGLTYRKGWF